MWDAVPWFRMSYPGYPSTGYPPFPPYTPSGQESSFPQYPFPNGFLPMGGGAYPPASGGYPGAGGYPIPGGYPVPWVHPGAPKPGNAPAYLGGQGFGAPPGAAGFSGYPEPPAVL